MSYGGKLRLPLLLLLPVIGLFIGTFFILITIQEGTVGLRYRWGRLTDSVMEPGLHLVNPFAETIERVSVESQHTFFPVSASCPVLMFSPQSMLVDFTPRIRQVSDASTLRDKASMLLKLQALAQEELAVACFGLAKSLDSTFSSTSSSSSSAVTDKVKEGLQMAVDRHKIPIEVTTVILSALPAAVSSVSSSTSPSVPSLSTGLPADLPSSSSNSSDTITSPSSPTDSSQYDSELEALANKLLLRPTSLPTAEPISSITSATSSSSTTSSSSSSSPPLPVITVGSDTCVARNMSYIPHYSHVPPLIFSLDPSDEVWMRKLVEYTTGYYTGSSARISELRRKPLFEAEDKCGVRMSAIEGHLEDFEVVDEGFLSIRDKHAKRRCARGTMNKFSSSILLVSDPFFAIRSLYLRNHVQSKFSFDFCEWREFALDEAARWGAVWQSVLKPYLVKHKDESLVIQPDILQKSSTRAAAIRSILKHMQFQDLIDNKTVACAVVLSKPFLVPKIPFGFSSLNGAVLYEYNSTLACEMWIHLRDFSDYFGFSEFGGKSCNISSSTTSMTSLRGDFKNTSAPSASVLPPRIDANGEYVCQPWLKTSSSSSAPTNTSHDMVRGIAPPPSSPCLSVWQGVKFLPLKSPVIPPLLLSFPGSGNTWVRLLIEYLTGKYTGAIYHLDLELAKIFPGEKRCNKELVAIKGHPHSFELRNSSLYITHELFQHKCGNLGGLHSFNKAVVLIRDPFKALFAEYQRGSSSSHTGEHFVTRQWLQWVRSAANDMKNNWENIVYPFMQANPNTVTVIRFENLVNSNTRYEEVKKLMMYLSYPFDEQMLKCAYQLSDSPSVHRHSFVTATDAYDSNREFICEMWSLVKNFASNFSYTPWEGMNCDDE